MIRADMVLIALLGEEGHWSRFKFMAAISTCATGQVLPRASRCCRPSVFCDHCMCQHLRVPDAVQAEVTQTSCMPAGCMLTVSERRYTHRLPQVAVCG
jgi:hypothetical protein